MAGGFGLFGVDEDGLFAESLFEDLNELRSESDFGDEEDGGAISVESLCYEGEIDVGFARASDAVKEFGVAGEGFDGFEGGILGGVERDGNWE